MPLYHVQDSDRPVWIIADTYGNAVDRWKSLIARENDQEISEVEDPQGVHYVCDDNEVMP